MLGRGLSRILDVLDVLIVRLASRLDAIVVKST